MYGMVTFVFALRGRFLFKRLGVVGLLRIMACRSVFGWPITKVYFITYVTAIVVIILALFEHLEYNHVAESFRAT